MRALIHKSESALLSKASAEYRWFTDHQEINNEFRQCRPPTAISKFKTFRSYSYLKGSALKSWEINWQHFQIPTKLKWQQACLTVEIHLNEYYLFFFFSRGHETNSSCHSSLSLSLSLLPLPVAEKNQLRSGIPSQFSSAAEAIGKELSHREYWRVCKDINK